MFQNLAINEALLDILISRFLANFAGDPVDFQSLTATNAAQGLTVPDTARSCVFQAIGATIRFTFGNEPPTAVVGFQALAGTMNTLSGVESMRALQFIREGGSDVPLMVEFFG